MAKYPNASDLWWGRKKSEAYAPGPWQWWVVGVPWKEWYSLDEWPYEHCFVPWARAAGVALRLGNVEWDPYVSPIALPEDAL